MTRIPQPEGARGSLKWIQRAVNDRPDLLNAAVSSVASDIKDIDWRSALRTDNFAEYRDGAALHVLGLSGLAPDLSEFWPRRGPQWDALGVSSTGAIVLVEAKAHVAEMLSPPTQAGQKSRARIEAALAETADGLGARPLAPWSDAFYQLANRLAMLWFLTQRGVDARLILVNFVGDAEMGGPATPAEWRAAMQVAMHVMGLPARHALHPQVISVYPDVAGFA
ncbi:MAG TPA: hypothetical protein VMW31_04185 [Devosiaceae bacterium]|nr:hypothetical protein [Devosiaceae bacterium]